MRPAPLIWLILLSFCALRLFAQPNEVFHTERLGTKDGLSHRWITSIYQDTRGLMWIGTYNGLNRYDGKDVIVYRPSSQGNFPVNADIIYQIAETPNHQFYLTTVYGILHFDPEKAVFSSFAKLGQNEPSLVLNPGRGAPFLASSLGYLQANKAISIYDLLPSGHLSLRAKLPLNGYQPVQCDKQAIWFWDFKGIFHRFDLQMKTWKHFPIANSTNVPIDGKGNLWLPDGTGLRSYALPPHQDDGQWNTFVIEPGKAVWLYALDNQQNFALFRFDLKTKSLKTAIPSFPATEFIDYRIPATNYGQYQYQDAEGMVWFAGFLGLYKVRSTGNLFQHYLTKPVLDIEAPPSGLSVRQITEDALGNLYLRSSDGEVFKMNLSNGTTRKLSLPPTGSIQDEKLKALQKWWATTSYPNGSKMVLSMVNGTDGAIWLRSILGLFRYDPTTEQFRYYYYFSPENANLLADRNNNIWSLQKNETLILNPTTGEIRHRPAIQCREIQFTTLFTAENTLWGFSDTGLVKVNTLNFKTRFIGLYEQPREQRCLVSHRGYLWIGTAQGLEKVDPRTFAHTNFDRSRGLPGNFIYSMIADGDYLWLGTSDGLCRFHVETGAVKNFYAEDGLSHNEFNTLSAYKASNGRIFMGGLNGINAFFPKDLAAKTTFKSRILLSRFSQYDTKKDSLIFLNANTSQAGVSISPSISTFNLHLALTSFLDPAKNQYAWCMDGLDEAWYYAGNQHVATYRHIPPGHYTFRAKAADSFGNWSQNELSIPIIVLRPWYSRWWAWALYSLFAMAAVLIFYRAQLSKKMEQAEKLRLQELDTFKSRFFTNITHEFRTPLTVIMGVAEQLNLKVDEPIRSKIGLIHRNGQNLLRLINQLLDLAKLESDALKPSYVQGDVLPYLSYITESLQSFANAQNVLLRVESSEAELVMDYDPDRLLQIVHNLLSNAIKFTHSGGKVTLRLSTKLDNLCLQVRDNGAGIAPEDLPYIFNRFYQGNNLAKAKTGGTGIGLSLTKELVKMMDGDIVVESELGRGSSFTVSLPISKKASMAPEVFGLSLLGKAVTPRLVANTLSSESSRPVLLIIEDNPDVVEYLSSCLDEQYQLDFAYNGRAGIEKALEISPDLIVSDIMMPEKDGLEVCEFLKNDERSSHIPIVLLTAKADVESRIKGLRQGADVYLAKPFHKEELLAVLNNLMETRLKLQQKYAGILDRAMPLVKTNTLESEFMNKLRGIIEIHLSDADLDVELICRKMGMSRTNLHNKLTALTGLSVTLFIRRLRLNKAKALLQETNLNVSEIAYAVGFNDPKYFSRVFVETFGIPPSEVRKN